MTATSSHLYGYTPFCLRLVEVRLDRPCTASRVHRSGRSASARDRMLTCGEVGARASSRELSHPSLEHHDVTLDPRLAGQPEQSTPDSKVGKVRASSDARERSLAGARRPQRSPQACTLCTRPHRHRWLAIGTPASAPLHDPLTLFDLEGETLGLDGHRGHCVSKRPMGFTGLPVPPLMRSGRALIANSFRPDR